LQGLHELIRLGDRLQLPIAVAALANWKLEMLSFTNSQSVVFGIEDAWGA